MALLSQKSKSKSQDIAKVKVKKPDIDKFSRFNQNEKFLIRGLLKNEKANYKVKADRSNM